MQNWDEKLNSLQKQGLYRKLKELGQAQKPWTVVDGQKVLLLASNNYLGLTTNSQVIDRTVEVIEEYGTGSGGSRLTTGSYDLHQELEKRLARFKGAEAAIIFNTGYMANLGVLTTIVREGDLILSDQLNHASIIDGCRLSKADVEIYHHADLEELEAKLAESQDYNSRLIVTDGVFSMDGDLAPLPKIVELAKKYNALTMVDDAHGTGVLGEQGGGIVEYFDLKEEIDIQLGTLSKALAAEGGFVAGSELVVDLLRNQARSFIYSTALAPGTIAAALSALDYLESNSDLIIELRKNIRLLKDGLKKLGYQVLDSQSAIIPIMIGSSQQTMQLSSRLLEEQVFVSGIRPPTVPKGSSRIRVTVMTSHTKEDIEFALDKFFKVGKELGII
ncbi:8-amino-7-oxononanoate synthase [Natroniella acetigena]|uniref:8-amino-7-oxononanoate synthase n=1 Tax=Natroniella acetigena TaxID=52004 RepID=UPI00200A65C2|nr:8-amino-7-oxononanoate synthase [Natroniella acetigena]MCK8827445.1 8-amino-7-oxononanoate synthase [Natroniella acetigena]